MQKAYMSPSRAIVSHERWRSDPYLEFIANQYSKAGYGAPPPISEARNVLFAEINHGRWIVTCPAECGQAVIASFIHEYFICANCGSNENNGKWYHVRFPAEHQLIDEILSKRKVPNRNWKHYESVSALINENAAHGIR